MNREPFSGYPWAVCMLKARGFTLIELLLYISILALLLAVAVPGFSSLLSANQLNSNSQKIQSLLSLARLSSVSHGHRVVMCSSDGANACTGHSNSGTVEWVKGALLFYDINEDRQLDISTETVLKIMAFEYGNTVKWNQGETLVYEPDGSVLGGSNGTFRFTSGAEEKTLVVSLTGRVRRTD